MNNIQILIDAFLYFARFPLQSGVLKLFNKQNSQIPGYPDLLAYVNNMANHSLIPGIKDYIFGVDEASVKKLVQSVEGYYLFIDYGQLASAPNAYNITTDSFFIAATVARPFKASQMDAIEELLITQQCYAYLEQIRNAMKQDDRKAVIKHLDTSMDATPFHAPDLNNSIGWTLTFTKTGVLTNPQNSIPGYKLIDLANTLIDLAGSNVNL